MATSERKSKELWKGDYSNSFGLFCILDFLLLIPPRPVWIRVKRLRWCDNRATCILHWAAYPGVTCHIYSCKAYRLFHIYTTFRVDYLLD